MIYEIIFYKKPTSPGIRHQVFLKKFLLLNNKILIKKLTLNLNSINGRNNKGKITVRHKGGRTFNNFFVLCNNNNFFNDIPFNIINIEYNLFSNNFLILCKSFNGVYLYKIACSNFSLNDIIYNYNTIPTVLTKGSSIRLKYVPIGSFIYNIEFRPLNGGKISRSGGVSSNLLYKDNVNNIGVIKCSSGKIINLSLDCYCQLGKVSNYNNFNLFLGKAGKSRSLGIRPNVRGVAMNPVDHPHGGGEGKKSKMVMISSPWGKIFKYKKING